jgi:hypothetical protein
MIRRECIFLALLCLLCIPLGCTAGFWDCFKVCCGKSVESNPNETYGEEESAEISIITAQGQTIGISRELVDSLNWEAIRDALSGKEVQEEQ